MADINDLREQHLALLRQQEEGDVDGFEQTVNDYIKLVGVSSSQISDPEERDQLRAILRYWASYIYSETAEYPNANLSPAVFEPGPEPDDDLLFRGRVSKFPVWAWLLIFVVIILICVSVGFPLLQNMTSQSPTETLIKNVTPTVTQTITPTITLTLNPTPTKTEKSTPTQKPTLSITSTPTQFTVNGSPIQFSNIQNGADVDPRMVLKGTYVGLNPGNSIHILLQPINGCGTLSILNEDDYPVKEQSGEWDIDVVFGEGEELNDPEQYNIRVAVAQNDEARQALKSERYQTCFDPEELTLGVFYFRVLVVNVQRGAYVQLDEERLLFSSSEGEGFPYDIATTKLDGTDFRLLTNTSNTSEVQPNLCSANQKIVFGEFAAKEIAVGVLWVMNSDGSDVVALLYEEGMRYEEPIWSPDCQYIAFGSRQRDSDRWRINFIKYEDPEKTVFDLGEGQYPTWVPDSHQLVFNRLGNPSGVSSFLTTNLDDCYIDYSTPKSECKVSPYPEGMTPRGKQPSISQSGLLLAYASFPIEIDTSGKKYYQILKVINLVTGIESNVTQPDGESQDWQPVWGLDSTPDMIYFESKRIVGYITIWRIKYDGTDFSHITQGSRINSELSIGYMKAIFPADE